MNAILQFASSHLYGLSPVCLRMCNVSGPISLNPLPQISHVCGYCNLHIYRICQFLDNYGASYLKKLNDVDRMSAK